MCCLLILSVTGEEKVKEDRMKVHFERNCNVLKISNYYVFVEPLQLNDGGIYNIVAHLSQSLCLFKLLAHLKCFYLFCFVVLSNNSRINIYTVIVLCKFFTITYVPWKKHSIISVNGHKLYFTYASYQYLFTAVCIK